MIPAAAFSKLSVSKLGFLVASNSVCYHCASSKIPNTLGLSTKRHMNADCTEAEQRTQRAVLRITLDRASQWPRSLLAFSWYPPTSAPSQILLVMFCRPFRSAVTTHPPGFCPTPWKFQQPSLRSVSAAMSFNPLHARSLCRSHQRTHQADCESARVQPFSCS